MSRKSKRNPQSPADAQPSAPVPQVESHLNRRNLFVGAVMVLLLLFVVAMLSYKSEKAQPAPVAAAPNLAALASEHAPAFGKADAKVQVVEFLDPACGTCAQFYPEVKKLLAEHDGKIRVAHRHLPLHQGSDLVVRVLEAARAQDKYLPTLEALYAAQQQWVVNHVVRADAVWQVVGGLGLEMEKLKRDMNAPAVTKRMEQDMADARALGVRATPEFFVNGRPLPSFGLGPLQTLVADEVRRAYP